MAMAGPQIGSISLLLHVMIILVFRVKDWVTRLYQIIVRPFRRDAR